MSAEKWLGGIHVSRKVLAGGEKKKIFACRHIKERLVRLAGWLAGWLISRERKILFG